MFFQLFLIKIFYQMRRISFLVLLSTFVSFAQSEDEAMLKKIYDFSLTNSKCYSWLDDLSNKIGHRLSGSTGAAKGVLYTKAEQSTWIG